MSFDKRKAIAAIEAALSDLRYGSIEITVHDGRVVQIDRTEKVRLEHNASAPVNGAAAARQPEFQR
jgi:hypothetical protein